MPEDPEADETIGGVGRAEFSGSATQVPGPGIPGAPLTDMVIRGRKRGPASWRGFLIGAPLGNIASHVKQAIAVGGKRGHRCTQTEAVIGKSVGVIVGPVTTP